jgi:hypothetical protein
MLWVLMLQRGAGRCAILPATRPPHNRRAGCRFALIVIPSMVDWLCLVNPIPVASIVPIIVDCGRRRRRARCRRRRVIVIMVTATARPPNRLQVIRPTDIVQFSRGQARVPHQRRQGLVDARR